MKKRLSYLVLLITVVFVIAAGCKANGFDGLAKSHYRLQVITGVSMGAEQDAQELERAGKTLSF